VFLGEYNYPLETPLISGGSQLRPISYLHFSMSKIYVNIDFWEVLCCGILEFNRGRRRKTIDFFSLV